MKSKSYEEKALLATFLFAVIFSCVADFFQFHSNVAGFVAGCFTYLGFYSLFKILEKRKKTSE